MSHPQPNNPLHGVTLKEILVYLVDTYGRERMAEVIEINCFRNNPSINSSLVFLRSHERARKDVEERYLRSKETDIRS